MDASAIAKPTYVSPALVTKAAVAKSMVAKPILSKDLLKHCTEGWGQSNIPSSVRQAVALMKMPTGPHHGRAHGY